MICLFTNTELISSKGNSFLQLQCEKCSTPFFSKKTQITFELKHNRGRLRFCSKSCFDSKQTKKTSVSCSQCGIVFLKSLSQYKRTKNHFCNNSCSAVYNNKHKKHGTRRSKLELFIESKLIESFPTLEIHFNRKDTINSELDIYIPSLNLAFELNGIFHYEPIYGSEKLSKIQNNDTRKFQACLEKQIELCIIDTHNIKYSKHERDMKLFQIISDIIVSKLKQ
jgi:hypothetical protein